jgi:hypothetical protein
MNVSAKQVLLLLPLAAAACAGGSVLPPLPSPTEIPGLEATYARYPGDFDTGIRLATAYREAARPEEAGVLVAELLELAPRDRGLLVLTGLLSVDRGTLGQGLRGTLEQVPS